jgi:hypothetical protein
LFAPEAPDLPESAPSPPVIKKAKWLPAQPLRPLDHVAKGAKGIKASKRRNALGQLGPGVGRKQDGKQGRNQAGNEAGNGAGNEAGTRRAAQCAGVGRETTAGAERGQAHMADWSFALLPPTSSEGTRSMPGATPRLPELYQSFPVEADRAFHVSEFAADLAGAMSPFGDDIQLPLPLDRINYRHPTPADRPHLAGD